MNVNNLFQSGYERFVDLLIQKGANIEAEDIEKYTPLNRAVKSGNYKYAQTNLIRSFDWLYKYF